MNDNNTPNASATPNTSDMSGMAESFREEMERHNLMAENARKAGVTVRVGDGTPREFESDGSLKSKPATS